jgi:hypothetical protein
MGACGSLGNHMFRPVYLVVEALLVALLGGTGKPATCSERVQLPLLLGGPLGKHTIHVSFAWKQFWVRADCCTWISCAAPRMCQPEIVTGSCMVWHVA